MSARSPLVRRLPCIACSIEGAEQPNATTEHHLNGGGNAGQKRRGDKFSVALCRWHHLGDLLPGMTRDEMAHKWGPSKVYDPRQFKFAYGGDENLLALTNAKLASLVPEVA